MSWLNQRMLGYEIFFYLYLSGYIGSKSFLLKVGEIIQDVKDSNPGIMYGEDKLSHVPSFLDKCICIKIKLKGVVNKSWHYYKC